MRTISAFLLLLSCLPAGATVAPAPVAALPALTVDAPSLPLSAGAIANAIDLYNRANVAPKYLGVGTVSSQLFLSTPDLARPGAAERAVEPKEIPALIEQGRAVIIKHSSLVMDTTGTQPPTVLLSTPKRVSTVEQLREWAGQARASLAIGDFDGALEAASRGK